MLWQSLSCSVHRARTAIVPRLMAPLAMGAALLAGCQSPPVTPPPSGAIAFAVFGDGPYYAWETARYHQALRDIDAAPMAWLLHVGDLFRSPCSNEMVAMRRREFDAMATPVIYVPGDNEWTDCHRKQSGGFEPLERLAQLRTTLLPSPTQSLGRRPWIMQSQASQAGWPEYAEHRRWRLGRALFATLHLVGSDNGLEAFATRTTAHDDEVRRRSAAALAWLGETFDTATAAQSHLIVLAWHGNPGFNRPQGAGRGYEALVDTLRRRALAFDGEVLVIHGDSHNQHVDQPLTLRNGTPIPTVTRLETFGSPTVGWVQVNVDTLRGRVTDITPHRMPSRAFFF